MSNNQNIKNKWKCWFYAVILASGVEVNYIWMSNDYSSKQPYGVGDVLKEQQDTNKLLYIGYSFFFSSI